MSAVKRLAEAIAGGLTQEVPGLTKPVIRKLSLAVGAMVEGQTPNTVELSNLLPLETERQDMREQWLRRWLKSPAPCCEAVMAPLADAPLRKAVQKGPVLLLSLGQTGLGNRMAVLMPTLQVGDLPLPLAWLTEAGAANLGFAQQKTVLERVLAWVPP